MALQAIQQPVDGCSSKRACYLLWQLRARKQSHKQAIKQDCLNSTRRRSSTLPGVEGFCRGPCSAAFYSPPG